MIYVELVGRTSMRKTFSGIAWPAVLRIVTIFLFVLFSVNVLFWSNEILCFCLPACQFIFSSLYAHESVKKTTYIQTYACTVRSVSLFNGISNFVGYLRSRRTVAVLFNPIPGRIRGFLPFPRVFVRKWS